MTKQGEMARLARQIVDSYCIAMPVSSSRILLRMVQVLADRVGVLQADLEHDTESLAQILKEAKRAVSVPVLPSEQRPADARPAEAEH